MSTSIEWTQRPGTKGETWNPTTGCNKVSPGCKNCYAEVMHRRLTAMHVHKYNRAFNTGVITHPDTLTIPLGWKKPRTVFVNSMSDLFHHDVPFDFIDKVFAIMALTPQHTYQILTKRPERMAEYFEGKRAAKIMTELDVIGEDPDMLHYCNSVADGIGLGNWPLPNVWLGTSVENQQYANERIPHLLRTPAAVRFLSCEPLLGPVDLENIMRGRERLCVLSKSAYDPDSRVGKWLPMDCGIDWVITGGESGHKARPMHPDWARSLRDQCAAAGVPFFFKQWGEFGTEWQEGSTGAPVFRQFRTFEQWVNKASTWVAGGICIDKNGQQLHNGRDFAEARDNDAFPVTIMHCVGKHASGNILDGRTHLEYPTPPSFRSDGGASREPSHTEPREAGTAERAQTPQGAEQLTPQ